MEQQNEQISARLDKLEAYLIATNKLVAEMITQLNINGTQLKQVEILLEAYRQSMSTTEDIVLKHAHRIEKLERGE